MKRLFKKFIEFTNNFFSLLSRFNKNREPSLPKLNLGCGLAVVPGWLNIDGSFNMILSKLPIFMINIFYNFSGSSRYYSLSEYISILKNHKFLLYDLGYGLPFKDKSVEYIFSSHFLEHLENQQAIILLNNCYRVLKESGKIRISIPDLEYVVKLYKIDKVKMLENYFFIDKAEGYHAQHKYMYDFEMLYEILYKIGFRNITRCEFKKGNVPDIELLDNRPEDSLFIEAEK